MEQSINGQDRSNGLVPVQTCMERTRDGHHAQVRVVAEPLDDLIGPVLDQTVSGDHAAVESPKTYQERQQ